MTTERSSTDAMPESEKGEGNYKAAKDYDKRSEAFIAKEGDKIEELAEDAVKALDGDEGAELQRAEDEGRSHAKK
ncbi:MAG: hypothetical protein JF593_02030 [Novosphingobium sp.]|nr:hypothetical protein [Novosphingobium sp.]